MKDIEAGKSSLQNAGSDIFVLDKGIFSNIFDKDIRRVYVYKKAERLAKAIYLITPAFASSPALRDRVDRIAMGLVDAAVLSPSGARSALSRELLALSSVLSIARTGGLLSPMNADLIAREAQLLLEEVAGYEEPRLLFDQAPTLAELARAATARDRERPLPAPVRAEQDMRAEAPPLYKGHIKDKPAAAPRRAAILSVLESKGTSSIRDIAAMVRDVGEKTIQRELQSLVDEGAVTKSGSRRWTLYALA